MTIFETLEVEGPSVIDGVDLHALAAQIGTPTYVYSASAIRDRIQALQHALKGLDTRVCYAVKANANLAVLQLMAEQGVGADIVSVGELRRALRAGIPASRIVYSGVGKTADEIAEAIGMGVWRYNVESHDELRTLQAVAAGRGATVRASARINPDVDAGTHAKISTGKSENKFGVSIDEARHWFAEAAQYPNVRLDGLHAHIGSQILSIKPFRLALQRVAAFARELAGQGRVLNCIDVGGGLGVCYRQDQAPPLAPDEYAAMLRETFADFHGRLILEPGCYLVAEAGWLLTRVIRVKPGQRRAFLVVDAAMNDLLRPELYDAWHDIVPLHGRDADTVEYDVVGPVCETGDTFAVRRPMPACRAGDLIAIAGAGAYGVAMASTYNSRPLPAEVLLDRGGYAVVRRRQDYDAMIADECPVQEWSTA